MFCEEGLTRAFCLKGDLMQGLARVTVREINNKKVEFPLQWFTWYTGKPKPWIFTDCEGIFVNAYNLFFEQTNAKKKEILEKGLHSYLQVSEEKPIFIDSGGFQCLRRGIQPDLKRILEFQLASKPDLIAVVDFPFSPKASMQEKLLKMEQTLRSIEFYAKFSSEYRLPTVIVPVVHAHEEKLLEKMVSAIALLEKKYDMDFPVYALGSMVYMVSATITASFARYYRLIDLVLAAKKLLPDKIIHVFGVGSPNVMYLLMYLGVDSIETFGWAGHGIHYSTYIAGEGTKALADRKRSLDSEFEWEKYACQCMVCTGQCPVLNGKCAAYEEKCIAIPLTAEIKEKYEKWKATGGTVVHKEWVEELRDKVLYAKGSWAPRACHNACVYSSEMKLAKNALKKGEFELFIESSLSNALFRKARVIDYAKKRIQEMGLD
jgi:tRNA-guanine family transglycosylase